MNKRGILKKYTGKGGPVGIVKKIGSKVRDVLENNPIASAVYSIREANAKYKSDSDLNTVKEARKYDNAPNRNSDGSVTDAFKVRSMRNEVKERLMPETSKAALKMGVGMGKGQGLMNRNDRAQLKRMPRMIKKPVKNNGTFEGQRLKRVLEKRYLGPIV